MSAAYVAKIPTVTESPRTNEATTFDLEALSITLFNTTMTSRELVKLS